MVLTLMSTNQMVKGGGGENGRNLGHKLLDKNFTGFSGFFGQVGTI